MATLVSLTPFLSVLAVVAGGVFSFIKWIDLRRRELKQRRWADYRSLIAIICGKKLDGATAHIPEQIIGLYQLLEFSEYALVSVKALESAHEFANDEWVKHVGPHNGRVICALRESDSFKEQAKRFGLD